ncbi:putative damage-inducible protein DinB [Variovorax sp. TBS-050B]|uniref:DinB family protein n=1 Tax=Variovorax sp. TBS-050B TaxID=2940551 RepID=UPI0024760C6D|nr:DinB family protein [Variovorax sp. TBS-050B]MDH6591487.1 putative damage-inducible protein DinB [Variovorax sp. TBS-050B]
MPSMQQHFAVLARYNAWAVDCLLDAVAELPEADYRRDLGLFFKSIHGTLNHLLVGEHLLWFRRFDEGVSAPMALDAEAEPDRARLDARLREGAARWLPLIQGWPAERFEGVLSYTTTRGEPLALPFAATLTHVFNHGTHHRGQVTAALTALGRPCPVLDLARLLQEQARTS